MCDVVTVKPKVEETIEMLKKGGVKRLIPLSASSVDADKVIQEFFPEYEGEDTLEKLKCKIEILKEIFPDNSQGIMIYPEQTTEFQRLITNYYSYLSLLILRGY